MKQISNCPLCEGQSFVNIVDCTDYTVSKKKFRIVECLDCNFRFTNPIPEKDMIGSYYESEDYISHSNTSKDLISKIYQIARKSALQKKLNLVKNRSKGNQLLDIGCGTGEFLALCKDNGLIISGIEPEEKAADYAKSNYDIKVYREEHLHQWENEKFDVITLWHVLEHVYDLNTRMKEINRLLKSTGKLFIAVPNCESADAKQYGEHWAAYDVPRHLYHFRKPQMISLLQKHGFVLDEILPMKLDAFYVSLLSEKYRGSGIVSYPKAFFSGLRSNLKALKSGEWSSLIYVASKS